MPSVKYLQLILMNLTVAGLSSSEFGESTRWIDFADRQLCVQSWNTTNQLQMSILCFFLSLIYTESFSAQTDFFRIGIKKGDLYITSH